ncbi:UDP-N-acetylglucosamine 2-epimerase [Citrifermentans bremense]|uniref:UDP-N-acetylglucosamine 2-epimerase n=1 Tax=Citrifermentans bremense TaxID=60035 RepID=UPI000408EEB7|nr:UDP-N-acetylglucosamine 2-epimerase [Citrifermentans bremense]
MAARKIVFISGTRADFGKIKPLIGEIERHEGFEVHIFATGMHMLALYGSTIHEVRKAGFQNIFPHFNQTGATSHQMDLVLANTIQGLSLYVRELAPDMIVVHGDRVEALAGAIVGSLNNILVAHIEGGERSGTIDDLIRHSVTKLSHLHFVANEEARRRLIQMGEEDGSVHVIGSPDVDIMLSEHLPRIEEVKRHYGIPFDEYFIFMYHPVTTELHGLRGRINEVVKGLTASGKKFVVIYPNNDAGSDTILEALSPLKEHPCFRVFPSIRFENFLTLLQNARAIVGNSSAGIREAPVYGVPTINIGSRQAQRFCAPSIVNIEESAKEVEESLAKVSSRFPQSLHFGKGNSAQLFSEHLLDEKLWEVRRQKQFVDLG